jgi:hypothetical protein
MLNGSSTRLCSSKGCTGMRAVTKQLNPAMVGIGSDDEEKERKGTGCHRD